MWKNYLAGLVAVAMSFSVIGGAHVPEHANLDTDSDGSITLYEARADRGVSMLFVALDVDEDGGISPTELARFSSAADERTEALKFCAR